MLNENVNTVQIKVKKKKNKTKEDNRERKKIKREETVFTLKVPIPQNCQTHSNNLSTNCQQIVWVCLTICDTGAKSVNWRAKGSKSSKRKREKETIQGKKKKS